LTDLPLKIIGAIHFEQEAVYQFENIWLMHSVELTAGVLSLHHCAASKLVLRAALVDVAVLRAKSCLINKIEAAGSTIELEYSTVLTALQAKVVRISDCILTAQMHSSHIDLKAPEQGCIRYSRYAEQTFDVVIGVENSLLFNARSCTTLAPIFLSETFGEPGCAVLAEQSTERIKYGAQDGGEMGAFHDDRLILKQDAVIDKLQGFLPVGISAVLVSDSSMRCAAPKNR
jgi:hypothetical protein